MANPTMVHFFMAWKQGGEDKIKFLTSTVMDPDYLNAQNTLRFDNKYWKCHGTFFDLEKGQIAAFVDQLSSRVNLPAPEVVHIPDVPI